MPDEIKRGKSSRYSLIDHTADFGIRIYGSSARQLFENAAFALFDQITGLGDMPRGKDATDINVSGFDIEDLMINWLRELLYLFSGKGRIVQSVHINRISDTEISASAAWTEFISGHHEIRNDIKAVTYHQIEVGEKNGRWHANVIFDL